MLDYYIREGNLLHPFIVHTKLLPETKAIIRKELGEEGFCSYIKELDISTEITLA